MAFSAITTRGSAVSNASGTTLSVSPSANITAGNLVVVCCASDNNATADGATTFHSVSDTDGHLWVRRGEYTETDGAADDGSVVSIWTTIATTTISTADSITLTLGAAKTDKIISVFEATLTATGYGVALEQLGVGQASLSASVSSMTSREYLLVHAAAAEGTDNAKTADADYTERFDLRTANSGTANLDIAMHVTTRIATLTSDTVTSTAWTNTNPITLLAALYEVPTISGSADIALGASAEISADAQITGSAGIGIAADIWTDGPKVVIAEQPRRIVYRGVYRETTYSTGTRFAFWQPLEVAAPSGDIVGASALTFSTGTVTLTGDGALAAAGALTFDTGTVALTGSGALATSTPLTFGTGTVTLTGAGELAGSAALTFDGSGAFEQGPIIGSAGLTFGGTFTLTGDGSLAGATPLAFGDTSALTGAGALEGSAGLTFDASAGVSVTLEATGSAELAFGASLAVTAATTPEQPSGGFGAENDFRAWRQRRKRKEPESKPPVVPPSDEAQAGPGSADATPQAPAADLELVRQLVAYWTGEADRELLNRRAQRALDYALRAQTVLAMKLFERELARQLEDDDMAAVLAILADD